ncbi:MAG: T9SS type A sorting domain-containing protein [Wenzhouxiangellaceae bacterium]
MKQLFISLIVLSALTAVVVMHEQSRYPWGRDHAAEKLAQLHDRSAKDERRARALRYDQPLDASAYWASLHETEPGQSPLELSIQAQEQYLAERAARGASTTPPAATITPFGPGGITGGRVRSLLINPNNTDEMLTASVSGGFFKTLDRALNWTPVDDFLPNLAVASMVLDPDNPQRVFAGTGEGLAAGLRGAGIFVSQDFGDSWTRLASTADNPDFYFVNRLARIPSSNILLAATRTGLFRSTDLGQNWTVAFPATGSGGGFADVKVDPSNPNRVFAAHYGGIFSGPAVNTEVEVNSPALGTFLAQPAAFGPGLNTVGVTANVVLANDGTGPNTADACEPLTAAVTGLIVIADRGGCNFTAKVANAQAQGASAVLIANNVAQGLPPMGGTDPTITIPSVGISQADGVTIKNALGGGAVNSTVRLGSDLQSFIVRSTDGGANWTQLDDSNGLPVANLSRMEIGIGGDGVIYIAAADGAANPATNGLYRSADNGNNFVQTPSTTPFIERQGTYDLTVAVDPSDSDTVYLGAVDQFRTTDAGVTITRNSFWNPGAGQLPQKIHADHHVNTFDPNDPNILWTGSDGGIYVSEDGGDTNEVRDIGLYAMQFYGIAVSPDGRFLTGGSQDNGTLVTHNDQVELWLEWNGGDGGFVAWDQQDGNFVYGETPNAALFGSNNGGASNQSIPLPDTTGALFIAPFVLDPNNGNRMLLGTDNVFFSANIRQLGAATWVDASGPLSGSVSALTISPHDGAVAYAGTTTGGLYRTTGLGSGGAWNLVTSGLPAGNDVLWVEVDRFDTSGNTVYAALGDFNGDKVFKSSDGGVTWSSIHGNLPEVPAFVIKNDPTDPSRLFLGTEIGLWVSDNNGQPGPMQWEQYAYGVPLTQVTQMLWSDDDTLWLGTYGRGAFRWQRDAFTIEAGELQQVAGCDGDDILDAGEVMTLPVTITNNAGAEGDLLSGLIASAMTPATGITISNPIEMLPDLAAGQSTTVNFEILAETNVQCQSAVMLEIAVSSAADASAMSSIELLAEADRQLATGDFNDGAENPVSLMESVTGFGNNSWQRDNSNANNGSFSWFAADLPEYSDTSLVTPPLAITGPGAVLNFALRYITEGDASQLWDGAVLEISVADGPWQDLGGQSSVPYDGPLFENNTAPGREAWSGNQPGWRNASVSLAAFNGETIRLRFRMISDTGTGADGFWVDDINVSNARWQTGFACDIQACNALPDAIFSDSFE